MHPSRASAPARSVIVFTRWFTVLLCGGLGWAGARAFQHGREEWRLNHEATQWPEVEGRVERGWVKTIETRTGSAANSRYHNALYEVMVDYTYAAEGQAFVKTGTAPRQIGEDEGKTVAQSLADSYAPGAKVTVFYRPGKPGESRLRRVEINAEGWLWFMTIGGLTAPAAIAGAWWMIFRYERKPAAPAQTK